MDSTILFLPELILIASILAIPAIYIATESTKSYSICANITLLVSLLLVFFLPDLTRQEYLLFEQKHLLVQYQRLVDNALAETSQAAYWLSHGV